MNGSALSHMAVIMDGNRRWAAARGQSAAAGHEAGAHAVSVAVAAAKAARIPYLSLFAFSEENWQRGPMATACLFSLIETAMARMADRLLAEDVRVRVLGDLSRLPAGAARVLRQVTQRTLGCKSLQLILAVNYSGQWEIRQAFNKLLQKHDEQPLAAVTSEDIEAALGLSDVPPPDLLLRTGGEQRLSNFYLWQLAYTELHFSKVLWPDVTNADFAAAIAAFRRRDRRFGADASKEKIFAV